MKRTFVIDLSKGDFGELQKAINAYPRWLNKKADELARRLAEFGVTRVEANFANVLYDGPLDISVDPVPEKKGDACYVVKAGGASLLFVEFGAGVHYGGNTHPEPNGFEHGTYGKGLGKNDYWFYTGQPGNAGGTLAKDPKTGYVHPNTTITHGNPVNMPVYKGMKEIEAEIGRIAKEVFSSD